MYIYAHEYVHIYYIDVAIHINFVTDGLPYGLGCARLAVLVAFTCLLHKINFDSDLSSRNFLYGLASYY